MGKYVYQLEKALAREYWRIVAEGRVLFLSLYDALDHIPTRSELYHRCHEMGDLVAQGLP